MPVYMIRAGDTDMVKIGWADDPEARRRELQCGCWEELRVIRTVDAPASAERWFHAQYAGQRVRGEWFRFTDGMLNIEAPFLLDANAGPVAEIIDALGGPLAIGNALGLPPTTVGNWKARKSIPARYHGALLRVSGGTITADQIVAAHAGSEAEAA